MEDGDGVEGEGERKEEKGWIGDVQQRRVWRGSERTREGRIGEQEGKQDGDEVQGEGEGTEDYKRGGEEDGGGARREGGKGEKGPHSVVVCNTPIPLRMLSHWQIYHRISKLCAIPLHTTSATPKLA